MRDYTIHPAQRLFEVRDDGLLHLAGREIIYPVQRPYRNDPFPAEVSPASFLVPVGELEDAVASALDFFRTVRPDWLHETDVGAIYAARLSPTGETPATHAWCWWRNFTDRLWDEIHALHAARTEDKPETWVYCRWPSGTTEAAALTEYGLKLVTGP